MQAQPTIDPKILNTIQNLMARRDHAAANENEAAVCADKIQQLLLKHNLAVSDVKATNTEKTSGVTHTNVDMVKGSFEWCLDLASIVSYACTCQYLWSQKYRRITFVGSPTDMQVATELYIYLREQIEDIAIKATYGVPDLVPGKPTETFNLAGKLFIVPKGFKRQYQQYQTGQAGAKLKYRRAFIKGCTERVVERLHAQVQITRRQYDLELAGQVTALVSMKEAEINRYVADKFAINEKATVLKFAPVSQEAFSAGYFAGDQVSLRGKRDELKG